MFPYDQFLCIYKFLRFCQTIANLYSQIIEDRVFSIFLNYYNQAYLPIKLAPIKVSSDCILNYLCYQARWMLAYHSRNVPLSIYHQSYISNISIYLPFLCTYQYMEEAHPLHDRDLKVHET